MGDLSYILETIQLIVEMFFNFFPVKHFLAFSDSVVNTMDNAEFNSPVFQ